MPGLTDKAALGFAEVLRTACHLPVDGMQGSGPSPRGGSPPKKGLIRNVIFFFLIFSVKFRGLKLTFLAFPEGPGGFRELREAGRNHIHLLTGSLG